MKYYWMPFKKCLDFKGKSSLKEFWFFVLINILVSFLIGFFKFLHNIEHLGDVYTVLILLPIYALGFRRLNDAGVNKYLFLIPLVNIILAGLPSKKD